MAVENGVKYHIVKNFFFVNGFAEMNRIYSEIIFRGGIIMKKKTMAMIAAGALVIGMVPAALFASGQGVGRQIVDLDDNGVCDNRGMYCEQFVDADQNGVCDNHGKNCKGFIDENNDGVCDNYSAQGGRHGHHGMGHGHGQGRGCA